LPTFGKTTSTGTEDSTGGVSIYIMACKYAPASSGTVTSMSWYGRLDAAGNVKMAIYADNAGVPGAKLAETPAGAAGITSAWVTLPISLNVIGGTNYWLAFISDRGSRWREDPGTANQLAYYPNYVGPYPAFPAIFPTPEGYSATAVSIYATYTLSGPIPPTTTISSLPVATGTPPTVNVNVGTQVTFTAVVTHGNGGDPTTINWYEASNPTTIIGTGTTITFTPAVAGSWEFFAKTTDSAGTGAESNRIIVTATVQTYTLKVDAEPEINVAFTIS